MHDTGVNISRFLVVFWARSQNYEKNISFVISVCLSVRPHGAIRLSLNGFSWNLICTIFFRKSVRKFNFHYNLTRITGTLHDDLCTCMTTCGSIILTMGNVSEKRCGQNKHTHFVFNNSFSKSRRLLYNVEKYGRAGEAKDVNIIRCMLDMSTDTRLGYFNIYCFSF